VGGPRSKPDADERDQHEGAGVEGQPTPVVAGGGDACRLDRPVDEVRLSRRLQPARDQLLQGPLAAAGDKLLERYTDDQLRAMVDVMRESARLQLEQAGRVRSPAQKS
jgi:hypothetical protein